jgi:formate hydrogenlyase transcriptional activator
LGSARTQKVDVRLIAATNANLEQLVADKEFRSDLYYRLNVFPITIPSLRDRREDIPLLARWFTQKFASRMRKPILSIPARTLSVLAEYHWPGNVRELENLIERAVILSSADSSLVLPSGPGGCDTAERRPESESRRRRAGAHSPVTATQIRSSAAARRGVKVKLNRSTLRSKMRKLGIIRPS